MAGMKSKADVFDPEYNQKPGMDNAQRNADSVTWEVSVEDLTKGRMKPLGAMSGPQVGNNFDADAMGTERKGITYPGKK